MTVLQAPYSWFPERQEKLGGRGCDFRLSSEEVTLARFCRGL